MHCTHTFPSTITPITQLSPITHLPWLPHHTCTSFTHSHISSTHTLTHCEVLFCSGWHSERFPCILPGMPGMPSNDKSCLLTLMHCELLKKINKLCNKCICSLFILVTNVNKRHFIVKWQMRSRTEDAGFLIIKLNKRTKTTPRGKKQAGRQAGRCTVKHYTL